LAPERNPLDNCRMMGNPADLAGRSRTGRAMVLERGEQGDEVPSPETPDHRPRVPRSARRRLGGQAVRHPQRPGADADPDDLVLPGRLPGMLLGGPADLELLAGRLPRLPRLGYGKALGVVTLWGLLFVLILTMISGARELMTPGAWKKVGYTYRLAEEKPAAAERPHEAERRQAMERLRIALWTYARGHEGRFPPADVREAIPEE